MSLVVGETFVEHCHVPRLKLERFAELWILSREDLNFCIRDTLLRELRGSEGGVCRGIRGEIILMVLGAASWEQSLKDIRKTNRKKRTFPGVGVIQRFFFFGGGEGRTGR